MRDAPQTSVWTTQWHMGIWTEKELYGIIGTGFFCTRQVFFLICFRATGFQIVPFGWECFFFSDLFPGCRVSIGTVSGVQGVKQYRLVGQVFLDGQGFFWSCFRGTGSQLFGWTPLSGCFLTCLGRFFRRQGFVCTCVGFVWTRLGACPAAGSFGHLCGVAF